VPRVDAECCGFAWSDQGSLPGKMSPDGNEGDRHYGCLGKEKNVPGGRTTRTSCEWDGVGDREEG
jgi:hypothetical protein